MLLFSSHTGAQNCITFINKHSPQSQARQIQFQGHSGIYPVLFPSELFPIAKKYWYLTGYGISSRLAEHTITGKAIEQCEQEAGDLAKSRIRTRIAALIAEGNLTRSNDSPKPSENDVWLYPGGQNTILAAHELCMQALDPSHTRKSVCFG